MCEGVNGESVFWGKRAAPGGLVPVVVVGLVAMRLEDCLFLLQHSIRGCLHVRIAVVGGSLVGTRFGGDVPASDFSPFDAAVSASNNSSLDLSRIEAPVYSQGLQHDPRDL